VSKATVIVRTLLDSEFDEIADVGGNPLQRLLRGNGFKPADPSKHPQARFGDDFEPQLWLKQLRDGREARVFPIYLRHLGTGQKALEWRFEIYRANPREHTNFDLLEDQMVMFLRGMLQRLATWNPRVPKPGGSGRHTFF
jgi:hypothetical protein